MMASAQPITQRANLVICFLEVESIVLNQLLCRIELEGSIRLILGRHIPTPRPAASRRGEVISRYIESSPVDPDAWGAFSFAESGKLAGILTGPGATDVRERSLSV